MPTKYLRRLVITIGCLFVAVEAGFSSYGVLIGDNDISLRLLTLMIAIGCPVGEAAFMHRAGQIHASRKVGSAFIAYCLWLSCFAGGIYMTINGAAVREEVKAATRVAGFVKRATAEKSEDELSRDRVRLTNQIEALQNATLNDAGTVRKLRAVSAIEADGRYLKSDRCGNINPANAGQRSVCQEYASAKDLQDKEIALKTIDSKLESARGKVENTEVVTSREAPLAKMIKEKLGMDPALFQAILLTIILHGITSFVWHVAPTVGEDDKHGSTPDDRWQPNFHVTVNTPPQAAQFMPAAPALALPPGHRTFDPGKQRALVAQFWTAALPGLPRGRQKVSNYLPDFDRVCARENIETPSSDVFCALSAEHLPNVEHLGGAYWFTPAA